MTTRVTPFGYLNSAVIYAYLSIWKERDLVTRVELRGTETMLYTVCIGFSLLEFLIRLACIKIHCTSISTHACLVCISTSVTRIHGINAVSQRDRLALERNTEYRRSPFASWFKVRRAASRLLPLPSCRVAAGPSLVNTQNKMLR